MADTSLRPRSVVEMLDATFSLLRRDYGRYITICAIMSVPSQIAVFLSARSSIDLNRTTSVEMLSASFMGAGITSLVLAVFWYPLIEGAVILAATEGYHQRPIDTGTVLRQLFRKAPQLIGATILRSLMVALGFLMLVLPALYFFFRYYCYPTAVLLDNKGPREALKRSGALTEGFLWRGFLLWLVMQMIMISFAALVLVAAMFSSANWILLAVPPLLTVLIYPIVPISVLVYYFDLRIRKEGYDLEVMSREMGSPGPAPQV